MATIVASRKRSASPFLDEALPAPPHLAKRVRRFTPCAAVVAPPPQQQSSSSREAAASRISRAAATDNGAGMDECAAVLVEQMAGASDLADAKNIASWILGIFKDAVAERVAAAGLREENNSLRAQASTEAASLKEENSSLKTHAAQSSAEIAKLREEIAATKAQAAALERDNAVLKRGVVLLHARQEETERAAAEMKKKAAELEMANYALTLRLRDADTCRFQAFHNNAF
ncbi:hypothetical protein QOZ80_4AG0307400 [Eleusine coracana subsp. coracana]|nr:hypothetical protein QOZ80_4AG0307400 [Eleusine coracana subsp. coracana]